MWGESLDQVPLHWPLWVCVPIIQILLAFSVLVGQGASARAGIAMGRNDYEEAGVLLGNSFVILTVISAVLCSILLIFRKPVLMAFGASVNTLI
jgi:Na+-driven multidrug efflux pump